MNAHLVFQLVHVTNLPAAVGLGALLPNNATRQSCAVLGSGDVRASSLLN
jgi:hypothetical protein